MELLQQTLDALNNSISGTPFQVHYAIKANAERKILKVIKENGLGADCVSGNEMVRSIESGFEPAHVVLAGVGKTDEEIRFAIGYNIHSINCESIEELEIINQIANETNSVARIAFRLNPNIDAHTHHHITTGLNENKFGIPVSDIDLALEELSKYDNIKLTGLHFHIGSQILNLNPYAKLCLETNKIQEHLVHKGIRLEHINMGGGLGVNYQDPDANPIPNFQEYFRIFKRFLQVRDGQSVHFELGRSIVAQMGSLISRVLYVKKGKESNFTIIDAGMTDLIRPALYNSYHQIENLSSDQEINPYKVVGPICETTDSFGEVLLPKTTRGDLLQIKSAGAYGQVLSSHYNLRDMAHAVYSDEFNLNELVCGKVSTFSDPLIRNGNTMAVEVNAA